MPIEIEAKIRLDDFSRLRKDLENLGAKRRGKVRENNLIFDRPDGALRRSDCGLRLRTCRDLEKETSYTTLTYKGPRTPGVFKSRLEQETRIEDGPAMQAILEALGFQVVLRYEKVRESWQLGPCQVEMDDLPALGTFVEVEGPSEAAVRDTLEQLNLSDRPVITQSYVQLLTAVP